MVVVGSGGRFSRCRCRSRALGVGERAAIGVGRQLRQPLPHLRVAAQRRCRRGLDRGAVGGELGGDGVLPLVHRPRQRDDLGQLLLGEGEPGAHLRGRGRPPARRRRGRAGASRRPRSSTARRGHAPGCDRADRARRRGRSSRRCARRRRPPPATCRPGSHAARSDRGSAVPARNRVRCRRPAAPPASGRPRRRGRRRSAPAAWRGPSPRQERRRRASTAASSIRGEIVTSTGSSSWIHSAPPAASRWMTSA